MQPINCPLVPEARASDRATPRRPIDWYAISRLDAHGRAITDSLFVSCAPLRSRSLSLSTQLQYENKRLRDDQERTGGIAARRSACGPPASAETPRTACSAVDRAASLAYAHGQLAIDSAEERLLLHHRYRRQLRQDHAQRRTPVQHLGDRLQLFAQLNAQWSGGNLDSAEQFDMGGPYGVRAFPLAATRATATKAGKPVRSCATALAPGWQLSSFVDQGAVKFPATPNTTEGNRNRMAAVGSGATWYGTDHQVSLTAAWPLSQENNIEPERTPGCGCKRPATSEQCSRHAAGGPH